MTYEKCQAAHPGVPCDEYFDKNGKRRCRARNRADSLKAEAKRTAKRKIRQYKQSKSLGGWGPSTDEHG